MKVIIKCTSRHKHKSQSFLRDDLLTNYFTRVKFVRADQIYIYFLNKRNFTKEKEEKKERKNV